MTTWSWPPTTAVRPNPDTDGDGLSDGDEVTLHSTLPDNYDSDVDGVGDGLEIGFGTSARPTRSSFPRRWWEPGR